MRCSASAWLLRKQNATKQHLYHSQVFYLGESSNPRPECEGVFSQRFLLWVRCESACAATLCPPTLQTSYFLSWVWSDPQWHQTLSDSDQQQKQDSAFLRCGGNQPHPAGHSGDQTACSKGGEYSSQILSASLWRSRNLHCDLSSGLPAGSCPLPAVSRRLSWELDCWRHLKLSCPWQEICTESRKCTQTCI